MSANDQEEGDRSLIDGQFEMLPLLLLLLLFMQEGASRQVEWRFEMTGLRKETVISKWGIGGENNN